MRDCYGGKSDRAAAERAGAECERGCAMTQLPLFDVPAVSRPKRTTHRLPRAEFLQRQWDKVPELMQAEIVFRPTKGWYAEPMEVRYFNDEGEYLGNDWRSAYDAILWIQEGVKHEARRAPSGASTKE